MTNYVRPGCCRASARIVTHGCRRWARLYFKHIPDLLTFPWVGSTASIGHFWAAADAAGRSLTCPLPAQRVHRGSRVKGGRRPSQRDALAPLTREGCTRRRCGPDYTHAWEPRAGALRLTHGNVTRAHIPRRFVVAGHPPKLGAHHWASFHEAVTVSDSPTMRRYPRSRCHLYLDALRTAPALCHCDVMPMRGWMGLVGTKRTNRLPTHRFPCKEVDHRRSRELARFCSWPGLCGDVVAGSTSGVESGSSHAFAINTGSVRVTPNGD